MPTMRQPLNLPERLAIFPLSGVVLLPFGHLPLTIFEPRYLSMIDDALGHGRIIGMVQPRANPSDPVPHDAALYDIGTAGRIVHFQDPGDGRYFITLEGVSRFRIAGLIEPAVDLGYRWVTPDFTPFAEDLQPIEQHEGPGRARLLELMHGYFDLQEIDADWDAVSDAPFEALVSSLAMTCPFAPEEKQALLECNNDEMRASTLISLLEMNIAEAAGSSATLKH